MAQNRRAPAVPSAEAISRYLREQEFQQWYRGIAGTQGLDPNPDAPQHFYDYRAAFEAGAGPDETGHWPSDFKREGHPNLVVGGYDTRTGKAVGPTLPTSELAKRGWETLPDVFKKAARER